ASEREVVIAIGQRDRGETFRLAEMDAQTAGDDFGGPVERRFEIGGVGVHVSHTCTDTQSPWEVIMRRFTYPAGPTFRPSAWRRNHHPRSVLHMSGWRW